MRKPITPASTTGTAKQPIKRSPASRRDHERLDDAGDDPGEHHDAEPSNPERHELTDRAEESAHGRVRDPRGVAAALGTLDDERRSPEHCPQRVPAPTPARQRHASASWRRPAITRRPTTTRNIDTWVSKLDRDQCPIT